MLTAPRTFGSRRASFAKLYLRHIMRPDDAEAQKDEATALRQERPFPERRFDPGCVKTCTNRAVAELFSPFLCFNDGCVSTMAASAVLFLFSVIEKKPPRASPTQEFSHRLYYRVQLVDEHAHVFAIVDGRHDQMHAALLECSFQHRREFPGVADAGAIGAI